MKICITNQCKQKMLENGLNFQVKGYVFLKDTDKIISQTSDMNTLTLNDFLKSNDTIVYNTNKTYFDTAYIPNLELFNKSGYNFGSYNIKIDKGLYKESAEGLSGIYDAILVIGETIETTIKQNNIEIKEQHKMFLAAIITDDNGINLDDKPKTITIHFNIGEEPISDEFSLYEPINFEMKDPYTTKISDYMFLTPDFNVYSTIKTTIKNISNNDIDGTFFPSKISLANETDKISNIWNVGNSAGIVNIFSDDGYKSNISEPQAVLTCSAKVNDSNITINSINVKYSNKDNIFSIGNDVGNDNLQVDILPENFETLNVADYYNYKMGDGFLMEYHPPESNSISSWYGYIKDTQSYFRLESINSNYSSSNNIFELRSENNTTTSAFNVSFYGNRTINNNAKSATKDIFIDSKSNTFYGNKSLLIGSYGSKYLLPSGGNTFNLRDDEYDKYINNFTYIGTNSANNFIDIKGSACNVSMIGKNLDTSLLISIATSSSPIIDVSNYPTITTANISNFSYDHTTMNIGNIAGIGFKNLILTRAYPIKDDFATYSVVFGHDNSYIVPSKLKCDFIIPTEPKLYFNNKNDSFFNDKPITTYRRYITADEGDYSLYKLMVVGNGDNSKNGYYQLSPAEFVSKASSAYGYTLDLFSVEKDSFQLVNTNYTDGATTTYIPKLFAVRGNVPTYKKFIKKTWNNTVTYEKVVGKYNLQNALYTPDSIYVPLPRTSNDVYKIELKTLYNTLTANSFTTLNLPIDGLNTIRTKIDNINKGIIDGKPQTSKRVIMMNTSFSSDIPTLRNKYAEMFNITDETEKAKIFNDGIFYTLYIINSTECKRHIIRNNEILL